MSCFWDGPRDQNTSRSKVPISPVAKQTHWKQTQIDFNLQSYRLGACWSQLKKLWEPSKTMLNIDLKLQSKDVSWNFREAHQEIIQFHQPDIDSGRSHNFYSWLQHIHPAILAPFFLVSSASCLLLRDRRERGFVFWTEILVNPYFWTPNRIKIDRNEGTRIAYRSNIHRSPPGSLSGAKSSVDWEIILSRGPSHFLSPLGSGYLVMCSAA